MQRDTFLWGLMWCVVSSLGNVVFSCCVLHRSLECKDPFYSPLRPLHHIILCRGWCIEFHYIDIVVLYFLMLNNVFPCTRIDLGAHNTFIHEQSSSRREVQGHSHKTWIRLSWRGQKRIRITKQVSELTLIRQTEPDEISKKTSKTAVDRAFKWERERPKSKTRVSTAEWER